MINAYISFFIRNFTRGFAATANLFSPHKGSGFGKRKIKKQYINALQMELSNTNTRQAEGG